MAIQTAERASSSTISDNYVYQRCFYAYVAAANEIKGNVLEIGTGDGYGVQLFAPLCDHFTTVDKFASNVDFSAYPNTTFLQMEVPPFAGLADNTFDYVVTFQVIEHIKDDKTFVKELFRVLKPGGKLIISTLNRKTSIARNPWHIREYTYLELKALLEPYATAIDLKGVYGNEKVMSYYHKNKESVNKIMKYDIFNLQYILPGWLLQIPYDYMNRRNRTKLLDANTELTKGISTDDFFLQQVDDSCLDFFYTATKK